MKLALLALFLAAKAGAVVPMTVNPASAVTGDSQATPQTEVYRDSNGDFAAHAVTLSGTLSLSGPQVINNATDNMYIRAPSVHINDTNTGNVYFVETGGKVGIGNTAANTMLHLSSGVFTVDGTNSGIVASQSTTTYVYGGGSYLSFSSFTHVSANTGTSFNIPDSSDTLVNFNATDYDALGEFNTTTSSGIFTARYAGIYTVSMGVRQNGSMADGKNLRCVLWKNNAQYRIINQTFADYNGGAGSPGACSGSTTLKLAAGDQLGARLWQNTGSTFATWPGAVYMYFTIDRLPN